MYDALYAFDPNLTKTLHVKLFGKVRTAWTVPKPVGWRGYGRAPWARFC
jgi:hypothetical protein